MLEDEHLLPLADWQSKAEEVLFQMSWAGYKAIPNGDLNKGDAASQALARHESEDTNQYPEQLRDV